MNRTNTPRYQTRFSNGFWKTFDTHNYTTVWVHHLWVDAKNAEARINTAKVSR